MENLTINKFHIELTLELNSSQKPSNFEIKRVNGQNHKLNLINELTKTNGNITIYTYNNVL